MADSWIRMIAVCALLAVWTTLIRSADAGPQEARVQAALAAMRQWVGDDENGRRWWEYLQSARLEQEIQRADRADPEVLAAILQIYDRDAVGLDAPPFRAVRSALRDWLARIDGTAPQGLPALARQAKGRFVPVTKRRLARARRQLARATARLDKFLTASGANGKAWKEYLKWDLLKQQARRETGADLQVLSEIYRRFAADHDGLAQPVFARVTGALRHYIDLAAVARLRRPAQRYDQELDKLAVRLKRYVREPTEVANREIGQEIGWLEESGQTPRLVRATRRLLSHANLYAQVSARLLDTAMSRPVRRVDPLTDCILGTSISGTTYATGTVHVQLVPRDDRAELMTVLTGSARADTVGRNGPAVIYSEGRSSVSVSKRLTVDEHGVVGLPASSRVSTQTTLRDIAVRGGCLSGIVERLAWRRACRQKRQAEAIASRHAEQRLNRRFDAQAAERLATANQRFTDQFRNPLLRYRAFPRHFHSATSATCLSVDLLQATRYQLGAPASPPALRGAYDLALRLHESMINNLAASLLAGRTFTDDQVRQAAIELYGKLPAELENSENEEPWSVTFARRQPPLTVAIADKGFKITLRGRRFTSGDRQFKAMNVTAVYKVERAGAGSKLTRQGELEILPPSFQAGKSRLSASQVALRRLLTRRLGKLFKPELVSHGLELPGPWKKVGKLHLAHLDATGGWLVAGWKMPPLVKTASAGGRAQPTRNDVRDVRDVRDVKKERDVRSERDVRGERDGKARHLAAGYHSAA